MPRPRNSFDAEALALIWREAWTSANPDVAIVAPLEHWLARARSEFLPPNLTLVHHRGNEVDAFAVVNVDEAYLHQLHVSPSAQGRGIGGVLVEQVKKLCPGGWHLHVAVSNERAQKFYARQGLKVGSKSLNASTGRERILYSWLP